MLLFSSLTAISRKEGIFFFLLLHSVEVFLLTWSIIKNQSNKVTFSNLNTEYKKLNCQSSLPNGTVALTLSHRNFQEWLDKTLKVHTFNFIKTSFKTLRQATNTELYFFLFTFYLLEYYLTTIANIQVDIKLFKGLN